MTKQKTIFVTGATGNQGGAVVKSLIKRGFIIRALTRSLSSVKSQNLLKQGVELVKGDLNDLNSFQDFLKDVDGIFSVQTFEHGTLMEIKQGIDLANLSKTKGISHFVYASVSGADLNTGIPHFESKFKIENHIKQIELPYTILRPTSLFENFLIPQIKDRILKGKLATPINREKIQQLISADDIGEICADIFMNTAKYSGKTITLASEEMDMQNVASIFTEVLGKSITYQKLPLWIARLLMGKDLYKMFKWINTNDVVFIKDIKAFKKEYPNQTSLKDWISNNFS